MRISTISIAVLLSAGTAPAAHAANDGLWCYRDFSGPRFSNCSFPSARQCLAIAGIVGGVCERNQAPVAAQPAPKKDKRQRS